MNIFEMFLHCMYTHIIQIRLIKGFTKIKKSVVLFSEQHFFDDNVLIIS